MADKTENLDNKFVTKPFSRNDYALLINTPQRVTQNGILSACVSEFKGERLTKTSSILRDF